MRAWQGWMLSVALWGAMPATAAETDVLAERLAGLRTEVEALSETLSLEKEDLRGELRALEIRKAELSSRIRQEESRVAELERAVERQREVLASDEVAHEVLTPVLLAAIDDLDAVVAKGLPYRLDERREGLAKLKAQVQDRTLDPRRGLSRVWQFVEDELRLTRENTFDRQALSLPDGDRLVAVARLGMLGLFWRSDDGRYGMAVREGDGWGWQEFDDPDDHAKIDELMDALKKQIRVGWFDLPWAVPGVTP